MLSVVILAAVSPSFVPAPVYQFVVEILFAEPFSGNEYLIAVLLANASIYISFVVAGLFCCQRTLPLTLSKLASAELVRLLLVSLGLLLLVSFGFSIVALILEKQMIQRWLVHAFTTGNQLAVLWLVVGLVVPIAEELLFRGYFITAFLRLELAGWWSVFASSILWGALHFGQDPLIMAQLFILGILLGWARMASGGVLVPILLHMVINLTSMANTATLLMY